jgi:hypothetical protein
MSRKIWARLGRIFLKLALDKAVRVALPKIYEKLDLEMPQLLENASPTQMTDAVSTAIAVATEGKVAVTGTQIQAVVGLYSPIAATVRTFKK